MNTLLAALLLGQAGSLNFNTNPTRVQNINPDGGVLLNVYIAGQAAGGGGLTNTELRASPVPISGTVATTGTYWQATQPVSLTSTTITGSVAVTGPLTDAQVRATPLPVSGTVSVGTVPVTGTFWQTTQPVSIASMPANQSVNVAQINGVTPLMGAGATGTGSPRVTLATDSPTLGTANGTIAAQSSLIASRATEYGSSPTAVIAGNHAPSISDLEGRLYVNTNHPRAVFCQMAAASTTTLIQLTGCAAVASNSYYVQSVVMTGGIATGATVPALIRSGTGANCATGTATWLTCWHPAAGSCVFTFNPPVKITQGHAVCAIDATVGTKSVMLTGYIAP